MAEFNKYSHKKRIPTDHELRKWIVDTSREIYPDEPTWGIMMAQLVARKPIEWAGPKKIFGEYGLPHSVAGWNVLVTSLTGLHVPTLSEISKRNAHCSVPNTPIDPKEYWLHPPEWHEGWGKFDTIQRERRPPVWDWRRKAYVPGPAQLMGMVR